MVVLSLSDLEIFPPWRAPLNHAHTAVCEIWKLHFLSKHTKVSFHFKLNAQSMALTLPNILVVSLSPPTTTSPPSGEGRCFLSLFLEQCLTHSRCSINTFNDWRPCSKHFNYTSPPWACSSWGLGDSERPNVFLRLFRPQVQRKSWVSGWPAHTSCNHSEAAW